MGTQRKKHWPVIAVVSAVVLGGIWFGWRYAMQDSAPPGQPSSQIKAPAVTQSTTEQKPKQVMVQLPNAQPIPALKENYLHDDSIWRLVNKSHPLSNIDYRPNIVKPDVAVRSDKSADEQSVRKDIAPAVVKLFEAASKAGHQLEIGSGFRSASLQRTYYTNYIRVYGQAAADTFSAKPGYSEHQTGLVVDVSTIDHYCYLEECFGTTPAGKWLKAHAHEYGFILRYPKEKQGITDFHYEPWHFRYVGKGLAAALSQSGLSLDEAAPYLDAARKELLTSGAVTE